MKKLITLRGNSGSGKTTIARALQEKFGKNTMLLSQDVIRRDILKTNDGAGTRANDVLIMLLEYGHAHNELVILEGILNIHINSERARFSPLFFVYCVIFCPNFYRCKNNFIAFCSYL